MPRRPAFSILLAAAAVALICLAYPLYVIRPFRPQGVRELQAALFILRWQHMVEILCAAAALLALVLLLRMKPATGSRIWTISATALVLLCAALSFVNVFEIMFHPAGAPDFQPVGASRLDPGEKLLAVNSRAYPIRIISYHHIVNDTEDGVPIAVTY